MDSLTQIVLGAAVGEVMLGKKLGGKAQILGAIAGTLPDLDVLVKLFSTDPIVEIQTHRAYSHSVVSHFLAAFPLAWISNKFTQTHRQISFNRYYWFWFLGLFTHALLDCCTTYGTRLFLPFSNYQVAFNNISVVDPLYTLPFMIFLLVALFIKKENPRRLNIAWTGIVYSFLYMTITFVLKFSVQEKFKTSLQSKFPVDWKNLEINTTPTIFNAVLWAGIAYSDSNLYLAEYSFLNPDIPVVWTKFAKKSLVLNDFHCVELETVKWFADEQYCLEKKGKDTLNFYIGKWGKMDFHNTENPETAFRFYFQFIKNKNGRISHQQIRPELTKEEFKEGLVDLKNRIGL